MHGKGENKYDNIRVGINSRLDTIQVAILIEKLRAFEEYELFVINEKTQYYNDQLSSFVQNISCSYWVLFKLGAIYINFER